MADFQTILNDAQNLSVTDQLRLIDALWSQVPMDAAIPLHEEWGPELQRRVVTLKSEAMTMVSWETVRTEALKRVGSASNL